MFNSKREEYLKTRASLKEKMLKAGPNTLIEVTSAELAFTFGNSFDHLVEEVEKERAMRGRHPMDGLLREADTIKGEPDHKAHLDRQVKREVTFEEAVKPLMAWLSDNHHPHVQAIVSATTAELVECLKNFNTFEFVRD